MFKQLLKKLYEKNFDTEDGDFEFYYFTFASLRDSQIVYRSIIIYTVFIRCVIYDWYNFFSKKNKYLIVFFYLSIEKNLVLKQWFVPHSYGEYRLMSTT